MILDTLAQCSKERAARKKAAVSLEEIKSRALALPCDTGFPFEKALRKEGISYICEVKKASPSKGIIAEDFPYLTIAKEYEQAGAAAISVLTEPEYFLGSDRYLEEIAKRVSIPVLRKDFTVDEYQIYEAKTLGASAVLLICSLLDEKKLRYYLQICGTLGLSALVEAHTAEEINTAVKVGAHMIGVNNRNLKTFDVDVTNCARLKSLVPGDVLFVAESGVKTPGDINSLRKIGADAVLIGETLMKSADKKAALEMLNGGALS